jgi:hypothetical protein
MIATIKTGAKHKVASKEANDQFFARTVCSSTVVEANKIFRSPSHSPEKDHTHVIQTRTFIQLYYDQRDGAIETKMSANP